VKRLVPTLAVVLLLAGCGGEQGTATLWVTRDRGAQVLLATTVPAGLTAMQALDRKADVETSYGGRFVVAINGVSSASRRDWFYYLNGVPLGRGAAEYRLRDGDVEWWDYTAWDRPNEVPAVVGAFPEPFLHGVGGDVPPAVVVGRGSVARALAKLVRGRVAAKAPPGANVLELRRGAGFRALTPRRFVIDPRHAARLVRDPHAFRFRYAVQ
jgi:Domain of unknown function (DUF4430)